MPPEVKAKIKRRASAGTNRIVVASKGLLGKGPGLIAMVNHLAPTEAKVEYERWLNDPITQVMIRALSDMACCPPAGLVPEGRIEIEYGVSSAFASAAQFLSDPTQFFVLFEESDGPMKPKLKQRPATEYSTPPDKV